MNMAYLCKPGVELFGLKRVNDKTDSRICLRTILRTPVQKTGQVRLGLGTQRSPSEGTGLHDYLVNTLINFNGSVVLAMTVGSGLRTGFN